MVILNANLWKAKSNRTWFQTIPGQPCTLVMQSLILLVILILASAESGCEDLLIGSWAGLGQGLFADRNTNKTALI